MRTAKATLTGGSILAALLLAVALSTTTTHSVLAQAGTRGQWRTLTNQAPINPIHVALLRTGQVLFVAGSGNVATETSFQAAVWDPSSETFLTQAVGWDMFCNGMVTLHDGRVLINGGNLGYDPFLGLPRSALFDPTTGLFTDIENMAHGRWYPTVTTLGDGRVMTFSGLTETGVTNKSVEIYTVGSGWSQEYPSGWTPPLYPRMHLSTDGRVFYAGSTVSSRFFNPSNNTWTGIIATTNTTSRPYGTSVLLPLTPANSYRPRVMILGGGSTGTARTELIDLSAATPVWQFGPSMSQPRVQMNATILPNGKVLATGGSKYDEDALTASLNADLYDPATNTFSSAGANAFPRLYHSNALLLPDATVLLSGSNPQRGAYERRLEIYSPAYLFNGDGTAALRPTVTGLTPESVSYGSSFEVQTPDAADIASVVLVRLGTPTHSIDMEQRLVGLAFTAGNGVLNVTAPPHGNIAPPGYYMLFVLNTAGVPSVARFMKIDLSTSNQAPVAAITSPASNVTVNPGGAVSFSGSGTDSDGSISTYSWTFPGGAPGSSSVATPGTVSYSTPGTYVASLTVTDDRGLASQPATRTVTVSNFSVSATPSSQTVVAGQGTTYTATVTPASGFTGTVDFSVTGLPSGASATFTPPSVAGSGSTSMSISTTSATPSGSYPLVISGTSGPITRTADVTLVVSGPNQAPVAAITSPASDVTINPGGAVSFSGDGTDADGSISTYSWTFPGGAPGSSSVATPGTVSYSTPGAYVASLTVTDNQGLASQPVARTVTVSNFSVSATPASQTVVAGQGTTFTATVTPASGFTGTVGFSVTGLPSGASATFTPPSVAGSGSTSMSISTTSATPSGSHPLVISGTSGPITRTANVTLVVSGPNQAPVAAITSPASNVTVNPGGAVSFSGSGTDADGSISTYSWTFSGGAPGSSSVATPGTVSYSTPGTYVASLTVTDNQGLASQPATRTVTVSNFSVSATPASQTVVAGQSRTYTATVTPASGFTGTVGFSVTGLPSGTSATFTPPSVAGSGSTSMSISTTTATPLGSYPLVIRGTSGPITRTANVTLVVSAPNQAPVAAITSPATNVTVNPGGAVSFSGGGTDSDGSISTYSWTFPGGAPGSSSVATPGTVSYSTPGTYVASLTVTDNQGLASQPATRTVTVSNFSVSATPASQTVVAGQGRTYTATVTPASGFTGTVGFSVTGLPSGASATFTPPSVAGSGTTSVSISTTSATPSGSYPLVIRGTSGPITRTANITLVVVNDFAISVTPMSRTIDRGASTTYTVTVTRQGFTGAVSLAVTGLPSRATGTFNPASVTGSSTSVLTVSTERNVQKLTRTLTITGSGGGHTHSVNVTLDIQ